MPLVLTLLFSVLQGAEPQGLHFGGTVGLTEREPPQEAGTWMEGRSRIGLSLSTLESVLTAGGAAPWLPRPSPTKGLLGFLLC